MKYDEILLRDLIKIYENRAAKSSNFKNKIKIKLSLSKYPKYFDNQAGYDDAIKELVNKNYIGIKLFPHDTVIDYIYLNIEKVEEIEENLGITGILDERKKLLKELSNYDDAILLDLKKLILNKIDNKKSIKKYLSIDFLDAIKAVHYIENLDHDVYERNASNHIFNDSKRIAKIKPLIVSIYNDENALEKRGIMSVTPYLYIKGDGIVNINNQTIDLKKLGTSIGLPIDDVNIISFQNIEKVITVENLTTFYDFQFDGLIIYLGGYSTHNQMKILKKVKKITTNFYHFGDIDYGGFTILNNLMENLEIDINAIHMDLKTLENNIKFAQSFSEVTYVNKLKSLLKKPLLEPYYDVIKYMIAKKVWLEQESLYNF